jgi:hypothetical protein
MLFSLALALTSAGVSASPMPPIELEKPARNEPEGVRVETFQLEIDQQDFNCSVGELGTGNRAPYVYSPTESQFDGELQFYPARCQTRF